MDQRREEVSELGYFGGEIHARDDRGRRGRGCGVGSWLDYVSRLYQAVRQGKAAE